MLARLIHNSTTVIIAVLCIVLFGMQSYLGLPREAAPDVKIPVVLVTTVYIGVAPSDIEGLVTIPVENELSSLRDVKRMTSTSAEGASIVAIEFEPEVVIEEAIQSVRDRVNRARPKLPSDVEEPEIREISFSDFPILMITLAGGDGEDALEALAEKLKDRIVRVQGVLDATVAGGLSREIQVQVDPVRLAFYGLSLGNVLSGIGNENVNIPGGEVASGDSTVLVRVPGEITEPRELEEVAVKRVGDRPVLVRDVATVVDGAAKRTTYARMNGQPAVSIAVTKRVGANIVGVAQEVKELLAEESAGWPEDVEVRVLADQSEMISDMVSELQNNIFTALVLVLAVLLFFLGGRTSLFVALAIPLSMLMGFLVIDGLGFTLNMIVLFSLILALGMLVDNAIVVVENIYRHMEEGKDRVTAAIDGTREVGMAVAASTATTVVAFFPLVFWTGIIGEFMGYLPKTIIIILLCSLVVALGILPVFTALFLRPRKRVGREQEDRELSAWMGRYKQVLEWSIHHRYSSAAGGFGLLIGTFIAFGALNHGTEFFPNTEPDRATIGIRAPDGTDLETTDRIVRQVESILAKESNVDVFVAETGLAGGGQDLAGSQAAPNQARITVDFRPHRNQVGPGEEARIESTRTTIARLRRHTENIVGAEFTVEQEAMGPPVGAPVGVEVAGEEFHAVGELARRVKRQVAAVPGVTELTDDYRVGRPEMRLRIDRAAAKRVGVSSAAVGNAIRSAVAGALASTLREGEEETDIVVSVAPRFREDLQGVLDLRLPGRDDRSPDTYPVPLSTVASYELVGGTGSIHHVDQDLVVTLEGDVRGGFNENAVRAQVADVLKTIDTPEGFHLRLGGADDEQRQAASFLSRAFLLGVAGILMVLVTQFNSLALPFIILATVILSLIGVLWGLVLTGLPFGIVMTGLGVISLAGVVVNNAIVLLDYVEKLREQGLETEAALVQAGMTRFRPVMLTAVTTVLGLCPMAIGLSVDLSSKRLLLGGSSAEWWGPMAVAVIFGLTLATILTLVMVPTLYSIAVDIKERSSRRWRKWTSRAAASALLGVCIAPGAAQALSLEDAFAAAEAHSHALALAREGTVQGEARVGQAASRLLPRVVGSGSWTRNEYETTMDFTEWMPEEFSAFLEDVEPQVVQERQYLSGSVALSQPLVNVASIPAWKAARTQALAAHLDEAAARLQVRGAVAQTYLALGAAREARRLSAEGVVLAEANGELARRQHDAGLAPRQVLLQAELSLSKARRDLARSEEQVVVVTEAFTRLTGIAETGVLDPMDPFMLPPTLEAALETGRGRSDLMAARKRVTAGDALRRARMYTVLPTLDSQFVYRYSENTMFSDDPSMWFAMVAMNWTLFDGGLRRHQLAEEASRWRMAMIQLSSLESAVEEQVKVAWTRYARTGTSLDAAIREVRLAEENLELARVSFESGSSTWLEVEQARLGAEASHLSALRERVERDMAAVGVLLSVGSL